MSQTCLCCILTYISSVNKLKNPTLTNIESPLEVASGICSIGLYYCNIEKVHKIDICGFVRGIIF